MHRLSNGLIRKTYQEQMLVAYGLVQAEHLQLHAIMLRALADEAKEIIRYMDDYPTRESVVSTMSELQDYLELLSIGAWFSIIAVGISVALFFILVTILGKTQKNAKALDTLIKAEIARRKEWRNAQD